MCLPRLAVRSLDADVWCSAGLRYHVQNDNGAQATNICYECMEQRLQQFCAVGRYKVIRLGAVWILVRVCILAAGCQLAAPGQRAGQQTD